MNLASRLFRVGPVCNAASNRLAGSFDAEFRPVYSDGTTSIRRANDAPIPLSSGLLLHSSVCPYVRGQHFPCLTKCLVASYLLFTYLPTVVSTLPHTLLTVIPKEHAASGPSGELHRAACHLDSFSSMTGNSSFNTRRQRPMSRMELRTASIVQAAAAPPSSPKPPRHTGCQVHIFFLRMRRCIRPSVCETHHPCVLETAS